MNRKTTLAAAVAVVLGASAFASSAQTAPAASPSTLDTVIVTGTRVADRTVAESQSPIDIITPEALQATGTTELATALARALPDSSDLHRIGQQPTLALGTEQRECQWRLWGPDNARLAVPFLPRLVTDDMLALKQAALRGVGVVALPLLMIREELNAGLLVPVGAPWQPEPGSVHAVFPSRRGLLPAVRELLDFMAAEYRENARCEAETQARHGIPSLQPLASLSDL